MEMTTLIIVAIVLIVAWNMRRALIYIVIIGLPLLALLLSAQWPSPV
jgi:hypothetical protein